MGYVRRRYKGKKAENAHKTSVTLIFRRVDKCYVEIIQINCTFFITKML